jgi:uncharacterized protein
MEQLEFFTVPSPCVRVCTTDEKGYCEGCMRKRQERFEWLSYTPAQQLYIIKLCQQRYRRKKLAQLNIKKQIETSIIDPQTSQQDLF